METTERTIITDDTQEKHVWINDIYQGAKEPELFCLELKSSSFSTVLQTFVVTRAFMARYAGYALDLKGTKAELPATLEIQTDELLTFLTTRS